MKQLILYMALASVIAGLNAQSNQVLRKKDIGELVQAALDEPSEAEAEAGTATEPRIWSAANIKTVVNNHASSILFTNSQGLADYMDDESGTGLVVFNNGAELYNAELGLRVGPLNNLTADVEDYTPTGWISSSIVPFASDSDWAIGGLVATRDGDIKILHNRNAAGGGTIELEEESTGSAAANRFKGGTLTLAPGMSRLIYYSGAETRWIVSGTPLDAGALDIGDDGELTLATAATNPGFVTLTDGATVTWTCDGRKVRQLAKVTLGGNRTLAISGATDGMSGILKVTQDGTGSRTLTLPAGSLVAGGSFSLTTDAAAVDVLAWVYDGTNFIWTVGNDFD